MSFFFLLSKRSPSALKFGEIDEQMFPPQFPQIMALGELGSYGQNLPLVPHATTHVRICHLTSCSRFLPPCCRPGQPPLC